MRIIISGICPIVVMISATLVIMDYLFRSRPINIVMNTKTQYRSKFEARCGASLFGYKHEAIKIPYVIRHFYLPDFIKDDHIIETKGIFDATDRRKMLAVKAANPKYRITLWFQDADLRISKKSKTTYREWAIKHGFEVRT